MLPLFKGGEYTTQINSIILKPLFYFILFWEALQFEAMVSHMRTFHMDLHSPIHVQLKIPTVDG